MKATICGALKPFSSLLSISQSAGHLLTNDIGTLHPRLDIRSVCPSGLALWNSWETTGVHSQFISSAVDRGREMQFTGVELVYVTQARVQL